MTSHKRPHKRSGLGRDGVGEERDGDLQKKVNLKREVKGWR